MTKEKEAEVKEESISTTDKDTEDKDAEDTSKPVQEPSVEDELASLQQEVNQWKTDYYKVFADMENLKRRLQNEHANSLKFMMQSFVSELLPVLDNFERSLNVKDAGDEVKNFLKGYELIYKQLTEILKKQGVKEIEALNQPFDPNYHQAVMTEKKDGIEPGIVIEELQKGYMLKDRVIRATLVKVSE